MKKTVGIIGAGTMGGGIAQVAALAGFDVLLYDTSGEALKASMERIRGDLRTSVQKGTATSPEATAALTRIRPRRTFEEMGAADAVIEAAPEDLEVKKEIFRALDRIVAPGHIGHQHLFPLHHIDRLSHQDAGIGCRDAFLQSSCADEARRDRQGEPDIRTDSAHGP